MGIRVDDKPHACFVRRPALRVVEIQPLWLRVDFERHTVIRGGCDNLREIEYNDDRLGLWASTDGDDKNDESVRIARRMACSTRTFQSSSRVLRQRGCFRACVPEPARGTDRSSPVGAAVLRRKR